MFGGRALPLLLLVSAAQGAQIALSPDPSTQSSTLVDLLSTDPDYTRVLSLLQRALLIPTLNKINGSTFFAPTNDAIRVYSTYNPLWADVDEPLTDNINYLLRQQLLYHLFNYTISSLPEDGLQVHNTLLFPNIPAKPLPWLPQPGGTLGGEPQRARLGPRDGQVWFGVDSQGVGGYPIVKEMLSGSNGNVVGVSGVVEMPSHLADVISTHPSLTYLKSILSSAHLEQLAQAETLSVFLPLNSAWDSLHPLNRLYLESEFAQDDISWIVRMHAAGEERVAWSDTFGKGRTLKTLQGSPLEVVPSDNGVTVAGADLLESDIYASNGVLHIVSDLLLPPGSMELTPEKYLLALNCTTFVSLLHSSELTSLINSTDGKFTILAPRDDVISVNGQTTLPDKGTDELSDALKYHFIEGRWPANKLKDGMLLKTALKEDGLNGKRQVLDISVSQSFTGKDTKDITFGGAGIIGDPIEINNILIYLISRPLTPPADALETALPTLRFSSFIASIFATDMAKTLKTLPESTVLMPSNSAFEKLGLVTTYLLMPASKPDLRQVIMHHTLDGVEYIDRLRNGSEQTLKTLEGSDLRIQRLDPSGSSKGSLSVSPSGGWAGSLGIIKTDQGNILTKTGVIHEIDALLLPRSVDLTLGKLVKAAKGGTMASLITRAGMDWVLNGTAPPEDAGEEWGWEGMGGEGWTLLCPTDEAFKGVNLTQIWEDVDSLRRVIAQHLIPPSTAGSSTRSFFDKKERNRGGKVVIDTDNKARDNNNSPIDIDKALNSIYSTVLSKTSSYGDLVFLHNDGDASKDIPPGYVVGVKDARGSDAQEDWARVLSWGRSTTGISFTPGNEGKAGISRGGVIAIDRLLFPFRPPWYIEYGRPAGVLVGGILLLGGFWWAVGWFWKRDTQEATYEPIGGSEEDE